MIPDAFKRVAEASAAYEARWTLRALLVRNPELYADFREQQALWAEATVTGTPIDVEAHTAALCRAWAAITAEMEQAPDDAYLIGHDDASGVMVAISDQKAIRTRVEELFGDKIIVITPHEVATLLGRSDTIRMLKGCYPGSELLGAAPEDHPGISEPETNEGAP